ncbi:putative membrane protein YdjX (TVP38/TMEM64 family) [Desulfobotulus alkaliphilus]|uniref:Putative membrane protein YdjX (TVP38/TMEM64 family) n=1 Tax=Desulfobotulus alkaliphilus TaxID=622671 RepID=A0A562S735_9BACT|nr:hypothetical protein [Desulfobotulus alkaliphilus]TWI77211.1 putative membrane protein YdjX (TVP38/TMEM64 family) [Desulfobotulus alkaliphilus]
MLAVHKKIGLFLRVAGFFLLALLLLWLWFSWDRELFFVWKQQAGPFPFFLALTLLPLFGFPTTPFYILAGATFGWATGLMGSGLSLAANLVLCHWVSRSGLRPLLVKMLNRTSFHLPEVKPGRFLAFTIGAKLVPGVPAFAKNYLIALSGVPFRIYFGISFSISMAYAASFVLLGESLLEKDWGMLSAVMFALALLAIGFWYLRRRNRYLKNTDSEA